MTNRETQQPVADVQVTATSPSGSYKSTTDSGGHFSILGLPSDTYRLSFTRQNYLAETLGGITVIGDQTVNVGAVRLTTNLKTIGRVTARSVNSAFQPSQTTDATTISGPRITQALGSATGTNENNLILAAPGTVSDSSGNVSIRGSLAVELGYQFDGMNFSVPFFDASGSNGYLNNITGGSGGSVQVVSGSGDATQGNIGAGVINTVPPRGAYPSSGLIGFTVGSPYYEHQFDFNYSTASPNGRFSNYFAVDSNRRVPRYAPFGVDAATVSQYGGQSFINHDDIIDNFIYRFGKNNNQSLQALFRTSDDTIPGNYGGLTKGLYYPYNSLANGTWTAALPNGQADFDALVHYFDGVPLTDQAPRSPEIASYTPLHFIKFGYNWSINPTTFLTASYANFYQFNGTNNFTAGPVGGNFPASVQVGGQRVTYRGDLTHQFGSNHTVTLATKYEDVLPRWHQEGAVGVMYPLELLSSGNPGSPATATSPAGYTQAGPGSPGSPAIDDFFVPSNPNLVSNPVTNPCLGTGLYGNGTDNFGCYVHDQLVLAGKWNGTMPRIPTAGIDYHRSLFQEWGVGLRDQWQVNNKLKLDYGVRIDGANYKFGANPFNPNVSNPSDVNPNTLGNDYLKPRIFQPRLAAAYQLGANDSVRASYGRSVNFFFAQTAGTPADMQNIDALLYLIPPKEKVFGGGPACGSGYHGPGSGYTQNPNIPTGAPEGVGYYFPCSTYAQSLFWLYDQTQDAPDLGGQGPPTYSNYDLAYQHQFSKGALNGFGLRLTGFARRGFNVEQNTLLANGPPDPVTGQTSASVFATRANGVEKTYGLEFMLTAPDRPTGFSGFLTMDYVGQYTSSPPVANAGNYATDSLPIVQAFLFNSNNLFRAAFLPPFQGRLGISYKTKNGFRINPIVAFDTGYPFGVGKKSYGFVGGPYGQFMFIPETNFGVATPVGGVNGPSNAYNASYYVDPAFPGNYLHPNIAASRGFNEPELPGNALTRPHANLDLDLEYEARGGYTVGAYVGNVFNNHYGIPYQNTLWQPVATGVGGPQTGLNASAYPSPSNQNYVQGARDQFLLNQRYSPFNVPYNPGTTFQIYLQRKI